MEFRTMDGETFARRRDRRVSFAETTAVHLFDRDDSFGGSPRSESNATLSPCSDSGGDESSRDTREDDNDEEEDDDEDEEGLPVPPVRFVMTESSPGSASVASVASNDDDNFFGPVSRSFMESGMVSDSGMSADNNNACHDITLDSTAFSLHFRNIGGDDRSANSAGSTLTTPCLDNKTPFVRSRITELSGADGVVGRMKFSGSMSSAGLGDFSFATNNSRNYDYGKLSATLNDLLRQVDDSLKPDSSVYHPINVQMDQQDNGARHVASEDSCPTDASVDQNDHGSMPLTGTNPDSVDVSTEKNVDASKPLTEDHPNAILLGKNGDYAKSSIDDVPCSINVPIDKNDNFSVALKEEIFHPVDVSTDQNSDGAKLLARENSEPIHYSINENCDDVKPIKEGDPCKIDVSMNQDGDGAQLVKEEPCTIDLSIDKNNDRANIITTEVAPPVNVSMLHNVDCVKLVQKEARLQTDDSIDNNNNGSKLGEASFPVNTSLAQSGDGAKLLQRVDCHRTNVSSEKNGIAMVVTTDVSLPVDVSMVQNVDCAKLVQREYPNFDVSIDNSSNGSKIGSGDVSMSVDVSAVQSDNGAKLLQREDHHPTDVSGDKNFNDPKDVSGVISHVRDVEKNVNYTPAFGDKPTKENDEDHSKNWHRKLQSNSIPCSRVTAISSPQKTIPMEVESAIALSSPLTTVQYPESSFPTVTPKVSGQTSCHAKTTQLSKTCQSSDIRSELFKHSGRISAINESILRDFPKENITSTRLDFENENMQPSQPPVEIVPSNQEFDLDGRKRKLQQFLGSTEECPSKHAKPQEHGEKTQNFNLDWRKLVEVMSDITRVSFSQSVQKLSIHELGSLGGNIEKVQMARHYGRLSAFLKNCDSADQQQQRLAEARSLHEKLLYEKAKLELNRLKLNKLRSKAELTHQRAHECFLLKSRVSDHCHSSSEDAYAKHSYHPDSVTQDEERLISKRQALNAIEQNIINLSSSIRNSCKITKDHSNDDLINIAKEHLKLKNACSMVQRDLKLWKLHDIVKQGKSCEMVLDYNFLFQRFSLSTGTSGSILVNTTLNSTKILQTFREINAHAAMEFVFGAKFAARNIDSLKFVRQETLETSLLLGNVIDVFHEVQAARRELLNLISTNFNCKLSNTNLQLQLSFMNFKRGKKAVISLDLSGLKFAMYPSKSSELHIEIDQTMTTFDEDSSKEIKALIQRLPTGRLMILRLCRVVSQYVHSS